DLLGETLHRDEAVRRIRDRGESAIADVLLDQRVMAGIGNIYKSETLFACGIHPFARVDALSDDDLQRIVKKARAILQRSTRQRPRFQVYQRGGQPCRKCGTRIEFRKEVRSTYWCPKCQPLQSPHAD